MSSHSSLDTNYNIRLVNVTIGIFLPDVELVNFTTETTTVSVPEAFQYGYEIYETTYPNGTKSYIIEAAFDVPSIKKEVWIEELL